MRCVLTGGLQCYQCLWALKRGLERHGLDVNYIPSLRWPGPGRLKEKLPDFTANLSEVLGHLPTDLLIWWQPQECWQPDILQAIKIRFPHLITCMVNIDDPYAIEEVLNPIDYADFDFAFTCCESSMPRYRDAGIVPILGYPPFDEEVMAPVWDAQYECDLSFVATNVYPMAQWSRQRADRIQIVNAVSELGIIWLWGTWTAGSTRDWAALGDRFRNCYRGWLKYRDHARIISNTKINLNSHVRPDGVRYFNERDVYVLASGGFMLTDSVDGVEEVLVPDKEIVVWTTLEELVDKAKWWMTHDLKRRQVAKNGRAKAKKLFDSSVQAGRLLQGVLV